MTVRTHDAIIPPTAQIADGVRIGPRVILAGDGIVVRENARLDAGCIIGADVVINQGAWVRPGAVVLATVPPNAIVEGNPAQVVGYTRGESDHRRPQPKHIDIGDFTHLERPARVDLGVSGSSLFLMRRITDPRGGLTVGEVPTEVPFSPARYFVVFDVPSMELRGEHAHRQCEQFLICVHGSVRVLLDDGITRCEVTLDRPDMGVFMPAMIWGTQYRYSPDSTLLVFASRPYEHDDYIRDYESFVAEAKRDI